MRNDCPLVLVPAYGRKYKTEEEAVHSYQAGNDWRIIGGPYCSERDFPGVEVSLCWAYNPNRYVLATALK